MPDEKPSDPGVFKKDPPVTNMRIWDQVCQTDPAHTKPVSFGRKFTSIDAMWQIQRATEVFGPVGQGWGYDVQYDTLQVKVPDSDKRPGGDVMMQFADVYVWWKDERVDLKHQFGPVRGCNLLCNANGMVDEDAPKKALTDALTKALSHLGFSADVFLGLFDDNKYVQRMAQQFGAGKIKAPVASTVASGAKIILDNLRSIWSEKDLEEDWRKQRPYIEKQDEIDKKMILTAYQEQRFEIRRKQATPAE